jgi:cell division septation protein DedD
MYNLTMQEISSKKVGRYLLYLKSGLIVLGLLSGCNFPASQEENPTQDPATAAARTLEAVYTKVASQKEGSEEVGEIPSMNAGDSKTSLPVTEEACIDRASFVDDITIRDNMQIEHGSNFIKVWRLRNDGTCIWNRSYKIIFFGGDLMGGPQMISLTDITQPGQTIDISLDLTAPESPGTYQGFWKLQSGSGHYFGIGPNGDQSFWVKISVVPSMETSPTTDITPSMIPTETLLPSQTPSPSTTPSPSATSTPSATPTASATASATPSPSPESTSEE